MGKKAGEVSQMNDIERFKAIVRFEQPDYTPIFSFPGAPGMSWGTLDEPTRLRLVKQGMPEWVGKCVYEKKEGENHYSRYLELSAYESWMKYWGTTGPLCLDFIPADLQSSLKYNKHTEGEYEILEYETGAITKQRIDTGIDTTYGMPEFREYHVRDRQSWEYYRDRMAPGPLWSEEKIEHECKKYVNRSKPLCIVLGSTYGSYRDIVGPYNAGMLMYDAPDLAHEIIDWERWFRRTYLFPIVQRLKPEILMMYEDCCYNHGMLISPKLFTEFCSPAYIEINKTAMECRTDMMAVDCDGDVTELITLLEKLGVNASYPIEQKAGNNLLKIREDHPELVLMGGLEKEVTNEGNAHLIKDEIMSKVPDMLVKGGYFPNGDHSIQPLVTFENLCKFMTLLHEVTGNPEGEFPRMKV